MDRIYTQEDYDKVTNLYNTYQNKKDTYSPEQQAKIEAMFTNMWPAASNKIEEWNNKLVDMWNDDKQNTWWRYWDWRVELLNEWPKLPKKKKMVKFERPDNVPTYRSPYNLNWELSWARESQAWAWSIVQQPWIQYM